MSRRLLLAIAAATGAAVMILELMAVRLMAPWFGQSQVVWTNVIGVVLAALAAGQWLGGRWAEAERGVRAAGLLLAAGALSLALPDLVTLLAPWTLPPELRLEDAWPFVTFGSLLVALLVLGLPMAALGAVTPWLVRLSRDAAQAPARVSGAILGAGTAGSLVGAFGATHVLLGLVGSAWAVRCAGALLVLTALALAAAARGADRRGAAAGQHLRARTLVWLLVPAAAALIPRAAPGAQVLASVETPYQDARVELDPDGTRLLRLNEGLDSFHSAYRPGDLWTERYFDAFVAPALLAPAGPDGVRRVLVLGLGGGTMARQIKRVAPAIEVRGIELDARLVDLGRRWFDLPADVLVNAGVDARVALRCTRSPVGAVLVDAYAQQIYVPPHLCTLEFFELLRERLLPGGVAALNLGGRTREDPVVAAVSGTFARVFANATMARVPGTRNMLLLGFNGPAPEPRELERRLAEAGVREHLAWMVDGQLFAPVAPETRRPLTDADAPVEALAHASWRGS